MTASHRDDIQYNSTSSPGILLNYNIRWLNPLTLRFTRLIILQAPLGVLYFQVLLWHRIPLCPLWVLFYLVRLCLPGQNTVTLAWRMENMQQFCELKWKPYCRSSRSRVAESCPSLVTLQKNKRKYHHQIFSCFIRWKSLTITFYSPLVQGAQGLPLVQDLQDFP